MLSFMEYPQSTTHRLCPRQESTCRNPSSAPVSAPLKQRLRSRFILFGTLRETYPVNPAFGIGKGTPVDRYYIDGFLDGRQTRHQGPRA